jgi:hypothetical protein
VGEPRPKEVTRARALADEATQLNKAFLCLELPRLAAARLHAAADVCGMLLAVRSSHGALLTQAAEAFFVSARQATARYPSQPLPGHLRELMQPPRLVHHAATFLADAGSADAAHIAATTATWNPQPSALDEVGAAAAVASDADGAQLTRRRSKGSKKCRASSPTAKTPAGAPATDLSGAAQ